jgi:hypothetical protein
MPALCRTCALRMGVNLPSFRTSIKQCAVCSGYDEGQIKNYSVPTMLIPGSDDDPNRKAEMEEKTG